MESDSRADPLVRAQHLVKAYKVYESPWHRLRDVLLRTTSHRAHLALDDVGFELPEGESLGLVGQNGAGKSTLLKLIAGVTRPTSGDLEVRGPVASLLELGMGFHHELSGRQNIRLSAAILGLTEEELDATQEEIESFCELGEFLDRPVKTYSTGMTMRLGFSVAVQVRPRLLIVDEALSVGDGYFQKKCMDRIRTHLDEGRSLLFCSHSMYYVAAFCQRALWLHEGRARSIGPSDEVIREYERFLLKKTEGRVSSNQQIERSDGTEPARLASVSLSAEGRPVPTSSVVESGSGLEIEIAWTSDEPERGFHLGVSLDRADGVCVATFNTHLSGLEPWTGERRYRARLVLPTLPLIKGEFQLYIYLLDEPALHVYDLKIVPAAFVVTSDDYQHGLVEVEHRWDADLGPAESL